MRFASLTSVFRRLRIRSKLILYMLLVAVPSLWLLGGVAYFDGKSAIKQTTFNHLTSVRVSKAAQIERYFQNVRHQVETLAENRLLIDSMSDLRAAFVELNATPEPADEPADKIDDLRAYYVQSFLPRLSDHTGRSSALADYLPRTRAARYLQTAYIAQNPHPIGAKNRLVAADDGSAYSRTHERIHPYLRNVVERFGYHDLFLVDEETGAIVYSVFKETDFATSLREGPYQQSNLSDLFRRLTNAPPEYQRRAHLIDFMPYEPSYGAPAAFIACPIYRDSVRLGAVVVQIPIDEINRVMTGDRNWQADGLGDSGETYLIGEDSTLRSDSRFFLETPDGYLSSQSARGIPERDVNAMRLADTSVLVQSVRTEAARAALSGERGTSIVDDYRGIEVLSSYAPLSIADVDWAILSEIDAEEAFAPQTRFSRLLLLGGLANLVLIVCLALLFARSFMVPILRLMEGARKFGRGDEQARVQVAGSDEFGQLAQVFNQMVASLAEKSARLEQQNQENQRILLSILPPSIAEHLRDSQFGERLEEVHRVRSNEERIVGMLAAFAPMDRRHAAAANSPLPERTTGALLFADISGFTPLTVALTKGLGGRRGSDELTKHLNRVYDALIGEVHHFRGSVIAFAGDAIVCWFDDDDGLRAVGCGLSMQRMMNWFADIVLPSGKTLPLALKTAITTGQVWRLLVGDPSMKVIDVVAGPTVDRVAVAEGLANQGEVVIGPNALKALEKEIHVSARRTVEGEGEFGVVSGLEPQAPIASWPPLSGTVLDRNELRPWLLPQIYERVSTGQSQFMAEMRPAVALFLNFAGLDFVEDDGVNYKLDSYVRLIQYVISSSGGSLLELVTGDKGCYLYAVFGAPSAHEDNAQRAIAAAATLRAVPAEMPFIRDIRIGLSAGFMRTGAYGSETRRTYGVLGDTVNMAARLMSKATPGQILIGREVADAVTGGWMFRDLGLIEVKGKDRPIPVMEVLRRSDNADEMGASDDRAHGCEPDADTPVAGSQRPADANTTPAVPSLPLEQRIDTLRSAGFFARLPLTSLEPLAEQLSETRARAGERIVMKGDIGDCVYIVVSGQVRVHDRLHVFSHLGPGEVFGELAALSAEPRSASVTADVDSVLLRLAQQPFLELLEVEGQMARDVIQLLSTRFHNVMRELDAVRSRLVGLPREREPATAEAIPEPIETSTGEYAPTFSGAIISRMDQLSLTDQLTLKMVSALAPAMTLDLLVDIHPMDEQRARLEASVLRLVEHGLLTSHSDASGTMYSFTSKSAQRAAYDQMLSAQQRQLHVRAARWYEKHHADALEPFYERVARHWTRALEGVASPAPERLTQAIHALERSGRHALKRADHRQAKHHIEHALSLLSRLPETAQQHRHELSLRRELQGTLIARHGHVDARVQRNLARASGLLGSARQPRESLWVRHDQLLLHITRADRTRVEECVTNDIQPFISANEDAPVAALAVQIALVRVLVGDHERADDALRSALALASAESTGESAMIYGYDAVAAAHAYIGWNSWFLGRHESMREHIASALSRAEDIEHPPSLALCLMYAALGAQLASDPERVMVHADRLRQICRACGLIPLASVGEYMSGWARACRGERAGIADMRTGMGNWRACGHHVLYPAMQGFLGDALARHEQHDAAHTALRKALDMSAMQLDTLYEPTLSRMLDEHANPH